MSFGKYKVINDKTRESVEVEASSTSQAMFRAREQMNWKFYGSLADGSYRYFTIEPLFNVRTQKVWEPGD